MKVELLIGLLLMFVLSFAISPEYLVIGVLFFLLGFNAHHVFALVLRRRRNQVRAPRHGMVYLRPHGLQAVRKEVRHG